MHSLVAFKQGIAVRPVSIYKFNYIINYQDEQNNTIKKVLVGTAVSINSVNPDALQVDFDYRFTTFRSNQTNP